MIRSVQDPRLSHVPHLQLVGGLGGVGGHHDGLEVGPGEGVDRLSPSAGVGGGRLRDIILLTGSLVLESLFESTMEDLGIWPAVVRRTTP